MGHMSEVPEVNILGITLRDKIHSKEIWKCCLSLGFWRRIHLQVDADFSEKHAIFAFRGWHDKAGK
jgi:hypothetical protein